MGFNAGEVEVWLKAHFDATGFAQFDAATKKAAADMTKAETAIASSGKRVAAASTAMAGSFQDSQGRWRAASGRYLSDAEKVALGVENMSRRSGKATSDLEAKMQKAAKGGVLALGAAVAGSIVSAARFEKQMSAVQAVTKASEADMKRMADAAKKLGAESGLGATKTAKAVEELAKGGLSTAQILRGGLKGAIDLALAGQLDLGVAAETTANALNLFGLKGKDAGHVADALATAANKTTADVGDFAMALTQGGGAAKAAGLSFDETVVALEALALSGVKGSDAGTSLKASLSQIAKPTKESAEMMKGLGLEFFNAEGKIKPVAAIAGMLGDKLGEMSEKQRLATLQTIAGTDGFRALLALYDQGPAKINALKSGLREQGTAAQVAADKTDNAAGAIDRAKAALENASITLGGVFLPMLAEGAQGAADFFARLEESGDLDRFAQDLASGLQTGVAALVDLAAAGGDVARVLGDVSRALQLDDAGNIVALATGLAAFKVAKTAIPGVVGLAGALRGLSTSVSPVTAAAAAVGTLVAILVRDAAAESAAELATRANAAAKRDLKAAIDGLAGTERDSVEARQAAKDATLRITEAEENLARVRKDPNSTATERARAELDLSNAVLESGRRHEEYEKSLRKVAKAQTDTNAAANDRLRSAQGALDFFDQATELKGGPTKESAKERAGLVREVTAAMKEFGDASRVASISELNRQRIEAGASRITKENAAGYQFLAAQLQGMPKAVQTRYRLEGDQKALSSAAQLSARLIGLGRQSTVTKIFAEAKTAKVAVQSFEAVLAGVPAKKVSSIITNARSEKSAVDQLRLAIASIANKTATITIKRIGETVAGLAPGAGSKPSSSAPANRYRAQGRGPGDAETAMVGEGRVAREYVIDPVTGEIRRVDAPTIMSLPDSAYVIATDPTLRDRSLGLFGDLARELGIPGYHKGKKGHKHAAKKAPAKKKREYEVPERVALGGVPFDDVEADYKERRDSFQNAKKDVESSEEKLSDLRTRLGRAKTKEAKRSARAGIRDEEKRLRGRRALLARRERPFRRSEKDWKAAKRTNDEVLELETEANLAGDAMSDAAKRDDPNAFKTAKTDRSRSLRALIKVLQASLRLANPKSQHARMLRERISKLGGKGAVDGVRPDGGELFDAAATVLDAPEETDAEKDAREAGERLADTGMSDAERGRLQDLDAARALAELTTGLDDDKAAAGGKLGFLEEILKAVQVDPSRGGSATVASIAGMVKTARDEVTALAGGGGTVESADLQAQIEQANERVRIAEGNAAANAAALAAFGSSGDIGTGRYGTAMGAAAGVTVYQTNQMLHPGDPQTLAAIGEASAKGFGLQGSSSNPPLTVGG